MSQQSSLSTEFQDQKNERKDIPRRRFQGKVHPQKKAEQDGKSNSEIFPTDELHTDADSSTSDENEDMEENSEIVNRKIEESKDVESHEKDEDDEQIETAIKNDDDEIFKGFAKRLKTTVDGDKIKRLYHKATRHKSIKVTKALLPKLNLSEGDRERGKTTLHLAAQIGVTEVVDDLLKEKSALKDAMDKDNLYTLHKAVEHMKVVQRLLKLKVDVDVKDKTGRTPLSYAAEKGQLETTIMLLEHKANPNSEDEFKMKPIHYAAKKGHTEVFRELAKWYENTNPKPNSDMESEDKAEHKYSSEPNCLDLAISNHHEETVSAIFEMEETHWMEMLQSRKKHDGHVYDTPMRKLIRKMPNVAREVFNMCTQISNTSPFEVTFNFKFLDDTYEMGRWKLLKPQKDDQNNKDSRGKNDRETETENTTGNKKTEQTPYTKNKRFIEDNHPLMIMVKYRRTELLDHPLVAALLKRKWMNIGLLFTVFNILLYAGFLFSLTYFALSVKAPYTFENSTSYTDLECPDFTTESIPTLALYARYGVVILAIVELVIELFEIATMFSFKVWNYFIEIENVLEWVTCSTAILFVVNTTGCSDKGYRPQWQWTCGVVSVFLAWINMLILIRKFEWFGIYVVMLYRVIKMFMKFCLVFSLLIIAFAIAFHLLFQNQEHFKSFWISMMKTTTMMIGGPDFDTTFLDNTVHYDQISYVFFFVFMLFMAIVVINLLVGLAVSNIQEFQIKADIEKKKMQVKFALDLERIGTSSFVFKRCFKKILRKNETKEVLKPSKQSWLEMKFSESWKLTERHIKAAMKTEKSDTSRVISQLDTKLKTLEANLETYIETKLKEFLWEKVEKPTKN